MQNRIHLKYKTKNEYFSFILLLKYWLIFFHFQRTDDCMFPTYVKYYVTFTFFCFQTSCLLLLHLNRKQDDLCIVNAFNGECEVKLKDISLTGNQA